METCLIELKGLQAKVNRVENILDPLLVQASQAYEKLNKVSNEHLQALNIRYQVGLMATIHYPMRGQQIY